jgi:iron(III)-enterobactin esterase
MIKMMLTRRFNVLILAALGASACGSSSMSDPVAGTGGATSQGSGGRSAAGTGGSPSSTGGASSTGGSSPAASGGAGGQMPSGTGGGVMTGGTSGGAGRAGATGGSAGSSVADPGTEGDGDFMMARPFTTARELTVAGNVMRGRVQTFSMPSTGSRFFPADTAGAAFNRTVQIYTPVGYVAGTPSPFIVLQDGMQYGPRLLAVLDNMISDGRLPKMLAVLIEPGPGGQRSREYDTVSDVYFNFIEMEVLPRIETTYNVKFTTDPEGRAAMGGSSGAPAGMGMAWFGNFRRILTYSGTFVNLQSSVMYPHGAWEYHENLIPKSDPKPIRIFLEVGDQDNGYMTAASGFRNWVLGNQGMAAALKAKGYHYRFVFGTGGVGHVDGGIIGQTLPEALLWLWRGYPR